MERVGSEWMFLSHISSYEVMAREHGKLIIPYISEIMGDVLKFLSSEAPSLDLQQACVKVVLALASYVIEPTTFQSQREGAIRDLANPILELLLGNVRSLAGGAAMCLQALVNTEVWKFASDNIVDEVCLRVTAALQEKETQTIDHMKLVCSLAEHNSFILEAYGTSLLRAAHDILDTANSQLRLNALQMIKALLKSVNAYMISSEIPFTITNIERFTYDRIPLIKDAASETFQIAKDIAFEGGMDVSNESFSSEVGDFNEDLSSLRSIATRMSGYSKAAMAIEQIRCSTLNHKGRDSECGGYFIPKPLLENGEEYEGDGEIVAECEVDGETSRRNMKTRLYMLRQEENGDESTCEKDCIKSNNSWINYTHSPPHSDVAEEKGIGKRKAAESTDRTDDMKLKEFSPPTASAGSLPHLTRRKSQSKSEFTDFKYDGYDKHDSLRTAKTGQMRAALRGRTGLDKVENVGDRISQEGSIPNSCAWSEIVQISDCYEDVSDNEEGCLTALSTGADEQIPRMDDVKENCQSSVDFPTNSAFRRGWTKVMKSILRKPLCAVLVLPLTMISLQLFRFKEDCHALVPT